MFDGEFGKLFESTKKVSENFGGASENPDFDVRQEEGTGLFYVVDKEGTDIDGPFDSREEAEMALGSPEETQTESIKEAMEFVEEEIEDLPKRATGLRKVRDTLVKLGVDWVKYKRVSLPPEERDSYTINTGVEMYGVYEDKGVEISSIVGRSKSSAGYWWWVGPKERLENVEDYGYKTATSTGAAMGRVIQELGI